MQQTGTLRKRRRRNLAKVSGLTNLPYKEDEESFKPAKSRQLPFSVTRNNSTTLHLSSSEFLELRKKSGGIPSSRTRPTRNPLENPNSDLVFDICDEESQSEYTLHDTTSESRNEHVSNTESHQRPYLFDNHTMSRLKQILFLGMTSGAFPWKWDNSRHRIQNFASKFQSSWQIFRAIFFVQTCCITLFQVYIFLQLASSGKLTNREIFITSFSLSWYIGWLDFALNMYIHGDQIREYINTLLKFNCDMVSKYVIQLRCDGGRLLVNFSTLGNFNVVIISMVYFIQMSYAPWYLFYYIYPKPWYWLIPGTIQTYCLVGQLITSHTLITWMVVAHSSTLQFWLKVIHNNNDSGYTVDQLRKRTTSFEVFKSLQVLNNCFNDCTSPMFIPIIKFHTAGIFIVCGYVMIRSMNYLFIQEFPMSLNFPTSALACAIDAFVILNMSAQVFDLGVSFIDSWSLTKDKDFRKTLLSCCTLKIRVGRLYFVTVSTTIKFFQVVWELITDAIISFP